MATLTQSEAEGIYCEFLLTFEFMCSEFMYMSVYVLYPTIRDLYPGKVT